MASPLTYILQLFTERMSLQVYIKGRQNTTQNLINIVTKEVHGAQPLLSRNNQEIVTALFSTQQ